ncbi:MAG: tRNA glutamyl-Q(34) synthetase GluQRS [Chloroflexi bacterium]|nr:tRNA glutamyl-Q(34) synthetase GluQRS [Chloroflexota bacterium]
MLRMEDIDRQRTRQGHAEQILADLRWLGLDWDEGPDVGGPFAPYVQSERTALYAEHLERLIAAGDVYPCYCSRTDIAEAASAPHSPLSAAGYPGTCRDPERRQRQKQRNPGRQPSYRFRITEHVTSTDDRLRGATAVHLTGPKDDFVVWRADGTAAYQLAVVVDDAMMQVGEVVRGADLYESTPLQLVLFRSFGYRAPRYVHVPLWQNTEGKRLSKRDGSAGIAALQSEGLTPAGVVGMLAASCGLVEDKTECSPRELLAAFSPELLIGAQVGA